MLTKFEVNAKILVEQYTMSVLFLAILSLLTITESVNIADDYKQPNFLFLMVDSMDGRNLDPTNDIYGAYVYQWTNSIYFLQSLKSIKYT